MLGGAALGGIEQSSPLMPSRSSADELITWNISPTDDLVCSEVCVGSVNQLHAMLQLSVS